MGKESQVEIPEGSGNYYRYEYSEGKTLYQGPVGDAPALSETEFYGGILVSPERIGPYNMFHLRQRAQAAVNEVMDDFETYEFEEGRADFMVDSIAPGAVGTHMPEYVIDEFHDLLYEDAQEYWDEENEWYEPEVWDWVIEPKLGDLADEMNEKVELQVPPGYSTNFFFGFNEGFGDYGLFLMVEKE